MRPIQRKNPFWSLSGPLLGYLGIRWVVEFAAQFLIMFPYMMRGYMDLLKTNSYPALPEITEAYMKAAEPAYDILLKYNLEISGIAALCTIAMTWFMFHKDRRLEQQCGIEVKQVAYSKYWMIAVLGIVGCVAVDNLMTMIQFAFYNPEETVMVNPYTPNFVSQLIFMGVVIPIAEELLFRGILFRRFRERQGFWYSAFCTAILYGLMNANTIMIVYGFAMSLLMAYLYEKFGSFKAPVWLHILLNLTSVILSETGVYTMLESNPMNMAAVIIFGTFICSIVFVKIQRMDWAYKMPKINKQDPPVIES